MNRQKQQQLPEHVEFAAGESLLNTLPVIPVAPKSDFEQLLEHPSILPDRTVEITEYSGKLTDVNLPQKYPAENLVFTSITQYAPEPEPRRMKKYPCPVCGYLDCPLAYVSEEANDNY